MRCITVKNYHLNSPIFCVRTLDDRAFNNGFRIVNPDFSAHSGKIEDDEDNLRDYLNQIDEQQFIPTNKRRDWKLHSSRDPNRRKI